jgi:hypothetical protein
MILRELRMTMGNDAFARTVLAVLLVLALGFGLVRLGRLPRDLALAVFAVAVAVLGIFAVFGQTPALIGGALIVGTFVVGAIIYGLVALVARLAR